MALSLVKSTSIRGNDGDEDEDEDEDEDDSAVVSAVAVRSSMVAEISMASDASKLSVTGVAGPAVAGVFDCSTATAAGGGPAADGAAAASAVAAVGIVGGAGRGALVGKRLPRTLNRLTTTVMGAKVPLRQPMASARFRMTILPSSLSSDDGGAVVHGIPRSFLEILTISSPSWRCSQIDRSTLVTMTRTAVLCC